MPDGPAVAVVGAGIGGLAASAALRRAGIETTVYEQAPGFSRVGAGIQMSPNAVRVLDGIGAGDAARAAAFRPSHWRNRDHDSGELSNEHPLGEAAEARHGTPYLLMHRGDLHAALHRAVPDGTIRYGHELSGLEPSARRVTLRFADGRSAEADAVIAADGVHSAVRDWMLGAESPRFTGNAAYRATFPASRLDGRVLDDSAKWWGPDRHIVIYHVTADRGEIYFTTSHPEPDWRMESWSAKGDLGDLRGAFSEFHEDVRAVLAACPDVHKWALFERGPLPRWSEGNVTLLGDACHPMTPYMAQGAATALEDAAVLSRCLANGGLADPARAFRRFEAARKPRTSRIQATSHRNEFMRRRTDPDWVYSHDAWTSELPPA